MDYARAAALAVIIAAGTALAPANARAQGLPAPPAHRLFGRLVAIDGRSLTLELRNGTLVRVDASRAFALGRVAAPLYRAKPVVVDGTFVGAKSFAATAVKRAALRPASWGQDR